MSENIIDVDHLSIRFNLGNVKVNNLKEYTIKRLKHELTFQEFLALKDMLLLTHIYWRKLTKKCLMIEK